MNMNNYDNCYERMISKTNQDVKLSVYNENRFCDTCIKEDVCMYKEELNKAIKDISEISDHINVFIDTDIKCKKWSGVVSNHR